jgi:hypothetical protein
MARSRDRHSHGCTRLVFPYPGVERFCRIKVFPPYITRDGHEAKYLQRADSDVHLYIPPAVARAAQSEHPVDVGGGRKESAERHPGGRRGLCYTLQRIPPRLKAFAMTRRWWKGWSRGKDARQATRQTVQAGDFPLTD